MKYHIDYQYMPKASARPLDDGSVIPIEVDETESALIPNVGDFVSIDASLVKGNSFYGRVRSRVFRYIRTDEQDYCGVNIVVEETDDDWGLLVKE